SGSIRVSDRSLSWDNVGLQRLLACLFALIAVCIKNNLTPRSAWRLLSIKNRNVDSGGARLRALLCVEPGELALVERSRPPPGPGEVLVRIRRAGVCGTDLHIYEGSHPFLEYPRVIGHALSGEIAETGPGCTIAVGQQVFVIPYLSCGSCVACRRGKTNCCQRIAVLGVHVDGGMADYLCVPEGTVRPIFRAVSGCGSFKP